MTSKKNPLALRKKIEFERIRELRCIMYENFKFEEWLGILGFEDDNKILYVFDRGGLLDAIKQSNYSTVMMKRFRMCLIVRVCGNSCCECTVWDERVLDVPFGICTESARENLYPAVKGTV